MTGSDEKCVFCDEKVGVLHSFSTMEADRNLRRIVTDLQDFELLAKISGGDLIAIEAKYHMNCLTNLRNMHRSFQRKMKSAELLDAEEEERLKEARAFVELVEYIEDSVENGTLFFPLPELHSLFENRLSDLGYPKSVNRFRLKNKILDHFQEAHEQDDGKQTVLIFRNALQNIVKETLQERDFSDVTAVLAKAAKIVRRDMFCHKSFSFSSTFPLGFQEISLPASLKSLISMIMNGLNVKDQENKETQACLTVCQTVLFNTKKRSSSSLRHSALREPPLPIYISLSVHSLTRCKKLITELYQLGLTLSYDRLMEIEDWLATAVAKRFEEDGCVLPVASRKAYFQLELLIIWTTTLARQQLHHHFMEQGYPSSSFIQRVILVRDVSQSQYLLLVQHSIPDSYANVPPTELKTTATSVPEREMHEVNSTVEDFKLQEKGWVEHALQKLNKDGLTSEDCIVLAAYHSSKQQVEKNSPALSALLPL